MSIEEQLADGRCISCRFPLVDVVNDNDNICFACSEKAKKNLYEFDKKARKRNGKKIGGIVMRRANIRGFV